MADVSGELVRMFFEFNGFFVRKETHLLLKRIQPVKSRSSDNFILSANDLDKIQFAYVDTKAWHAEVFFPSLINSSPELFAFMRKGPLKKAEEFFGTKNFKKIIVVSRLPNVKATLKKSVVLLKQNGVDHVIEFPVILDYLVNEVKTNVNYVESDCLQLIRIFKCHHFYRVPQLELKWR